MSLPQRCEKLKMTELKQICKRIYESKNKDKALIVLLCGDLGAGKTTLVKEFVKLYDSDVLVTSPTFNILQEYKNVFHYDIYRKDVNELLSMGFLEMLESNKFHFIEWGDESLKKFLEQYGYEVMLISIGFKDEKSRIYKVAV